MSTPEQTNEAACGGSGLTAELGGWIAVTDQIPKSGMPVLVACGKKVLRAAHAAKFALSEDDWGYWNDGDGADYNDADDTTYWPEGWYEWNEQEETHWQLDHEPTYWMPLPKVPNAQGKPTAANELNEG